MATGFPVKGPSLIGCAFRLLPGKALSATTAKTDKSPPLFTVVLLLLLRVLFFQEKTDFFK
jgi:hypothetical protein